MKMTLISVLSSWLCATGAAVLVNYYIPTSFQDTPKEQKKAAGVAARISKRGTIPEYKPKSRHSSAIKKTTAAKVIKKEVDRPLYVSNPIYPPFTNALHQLKEEVAEIAKDGEVDLSYGFTLSVRDGMPVLNYPEEYTNIVIGGVAMGEALKGGFFWVRRGWRGNMWGVDEVGLSMCRRLDEPEFYCTHVTYSALPATRQVDAIRMHGNLNLGNTARAYDVVEEISQWMAEDYGAVDLDVAVPAGTLALKKLKIGNGLSVVVSVNWNRWQAVDGSDAHIDISFTADELVEEDKCQRQELGEVVDVERISVLDETGVNYLTVRPVVSSEAVKSKVVY